MTDPRPARKPLTGWRVLFGWTRFLLLIAVLYVGVMALAAFLPGILSGIHVDFSAPKDYVYLIPKGYVGDVYVLSNAADGVVPRTENGTVIFELYRLAPPKPRSSAR
jgi:hypothetical protein